MAAFCACGHVACSCRGFWQPSFEAAVQTLFRRELHWRGFPRPTGGVEAQDSLARRDHASGHVAAGVHAAADSAGSKAQAAPDRIHGVLAPTAKLRALVVPQESKSSAQAAKPAQCEANCAHHGPVRLSWARLLKRVFEIDLEHCPNCGGELKIIAAILWGEPGHKRS